MNIIRVNLTHSFENFQKYKIITNPLKHVGYGPILRAQKGDIVLIRTTGNMVSAIGVITNKYLGNVDYYVKGIKLTNTESLNTVHVDVLAWFDKPTSFFDVDESVWKCPWFSNQVPETDKLLEQINFLISGVKS